FSCDGFCSLRTKTPQCIVIHDLAFLHYPDFNKRSHISYIKRNMPRFIRKAKTIATVSAFSRQDLIKNYPVGPQKIDVVYSAAKDIFKPLSEEQKIATKEEHTNAKEYFIYAGAIHPRKNLMNLLKAFSLFKKRM